MLPDVDYGITVKVQRMVPELDPDPTFAGLYARATTIAGARCHDFGRADPGVHHWIKCHAWRIVPAGSSSLMFAIVVMGLMRPAAGQMPPPGKPEPTTEELMTSGGATMEEMQHRSPQRATEIPEAVLPPTRRKPYPVTMVSNGARSL